MIGWCAHAWIPGTTGCQQPSTLDRSASLHALPLPAKFLLQKQNHQTLARRSKRIISNCASDGLGSLDFEASTAGADIMASRQHSSSCCLLTCLRDFSLNWIMRFSHPMGVTQFRSHWSSACADTWDCAVRNEPRHNLVTMATSSICTVKGNDSDERWSTLYGMVAACKLLTQILVQDWNCGLPPSGSQGCNPQMLHLFHGLRPWNGVPSTSPSKHLSMWAAGERCTRTNCAHERIKENPCKLHRECALMKPEDTTADRPQQTPP